MLFPASYLCLQVTDVCKYLKLLVTSSSSSLKWTTELALLFMVMQESEKTWSMNFWVGCWVFKVGTSENIFESQVEVTYWTVTFEVFSAVFIVIKEQDCRLKFSEECSRSLCSHTYSIITSAVWPGEGKGRPGKEELIVWRWEVFLLDFLIHFKVQNTLCKIISKI